MPEVGTAPARTVSPLRFCAAVVGLLLVSTAGAEAAAAGTGSLSEQRLAVVRRLLAEYSKTQDPTRQLVTARKTILEQFSQECACELYPTSPPGTEEDCVTEATKETDAVVAEKCPPLVPERLEAEAAERYPIYEVGKPVTVTYQANPARTITVQGPYRGKTPDSIVVGGHKVLLRDMAIVRENQAELLKFNPEQSTALRREYIEQKTREYEEAREALRKRVFEAALVAARELVASRNELKGYVLLDGTWERVPNVVRRLIELEKQRRRGGGKTTMVAAVPPKPPAPVRPTPPRPTAETTTTSPAVASPGTPPPVVVKPTTDGGQPPEDVAVSPPASVTETGRSVEKPVSDTPSAPGLTGTTPDTGAEPPTETDAGKTAATGAEAPATDAAPPTTSAAEPAVASTGGAATGPAQAEGTPPPSELTRIAAFGGIAVALLGAIGFSVMVLLKGRPASAFYVSRPEVEKGFWPLTETNLAQFKFVSYRYGTAEDARKALLRLSFVQEAKPGGRLVSPLAVHFGYYQEDEEKFVAFVGGTELSYSMWREAVSQLSRIEGTIEHRISAAPERRTRVPDPMSLSGSARDIKLLDETDGAGDDYAHYCRYQGPDKASAVAFLKKVVIKDNGEHVVVQTPEGHWARDLRGIYRE